MKNYTVFLTLLSMVFLASCGGNRVDVDLSDVVVNEVNINRLEQDIFTMDTSNVLKATEKLQKKYGKFYSGYIAGVINNGNVTDSSYSYRMKRFVNDRDMRDAYTDCQKTYPNVEFLKQEFTGVFKHFKYYFPDKKTPKIVTMMSGFNYPVVYIDSTLSIGLEMYLGSNNKFYQMLAMPRYKSLFMNKETIAPDAVRTWMMEEFSYNLNQSDFLSEVVYVGKIMYLTDVLLPEVNDSLKIQYTQKQLEYCTQNEFNVWSYFVAQKLLYTTNQAEIVKFTSEGPFTSAFSKDSPPRIGYWIGWQIVRQYMKNNPNITVEQLMQQNDAQQLLAKSKYKPKN
jgi:gliding motility-associated lipoprotein GldB